MNIGLTKGLIGSLTDLNCYPFNEIWRTLHWPPEAAADKELECYKPMLRLIIRWLDMYYGRPLTPNSAITRTAVRENLEKFFREFTISDSADIATIHRQGRQGFIFWILFHIFGWFRNLEILEGEMRYQPIPNAKELSIADFKTAVRNFVNPPEKELRMIWKVCESQRLGAIKQGEACHKYLLRLFYYAMQYAGGRFEIFPEPTTEELREQALRFIDALPWEENSFIFKIAATDPAAVHLIALYDIIQVYYCLPWPKIPGYLRVALGQFGH